MKLSSLVLATIVLSASSTPALAWTFVETMNAYGDAATGIVQPARNATGAVLAIGCDGARWRMVAVGPPAGGGIKLDAGGEVRISFGPDLGSKGTWQVRKREATDIVYLAPAPSELVRQMIGRERSSSESVLRIGVRSGGKPVVLEFPVAGLRAAIRKDLWEPCKLGNAVPESEFDEN